jgi:PAS domain-containing protein
VLEILAWAILFFTVFLVIASSRGVLLMLTGRGAIDRVVHGHVVPLDIVPVSNSVVLSCFREPNKYKGGSGFLKARAVYDPVYDSIVDKSAISIARIRDGAISDLNASGDALLMKCVSSGLYQKLDLSNSNAIIPEVLWVKVLVVSSRGRYVALWPALPSVKSELLRRMLTDQLTATKYKASDYRSRIQGEDIFTGEKVVDIGDSKEDAAIFARVVTVVSLRVSSAPSTFKLSVFLNFCTIFIFCCINFLVVRRLPTEEFVSWYRAWLCWAMVYASYSLIYLVRLPFVGVSQFRPFFIEVIPIFSIFNDSFFLIVALYMMQWRTRRMRYRVALIAGFIAIGALVAGQESKWVQSNYRVVESLYSVGVSVFLGMAFTKILKKRRATIAGFELVGSQLTSILVGVFFLVLAGHQLLIAIWRGRPGLEEIFWLLSPVMKMCLMALFFLAVMTDRYWGEGEVGLEVFNRLEQGVFAVDHKGKIINVNDSAARILSLPKHSMIGKNIKEILFRSLFESERLFQDLGASRGLKDRKMLTKDYRGTDIKEFRDVHRLVSAQVVGETGRDRVYALLYIAGE